MTLSGGVTGLALVVLGASSAVPTPTAVRVDVDAPSGCSDARTFFERLRARTDRVRLAQPDEAALVIDVKLSRAAGKVHGELRLKQQDSESATRQVDGATCEEVVGVLSLTAALALERLVAPHDEANGTTPGESRNEAGTSGAGGSADAAHASGGAVATSLAGAENARAGAGSQREPSNDAASGSNGDGPDARARRSARQVGFEVGAQLGFSQVLSPLLATGAGPFVRLRRDGASLGLSGTYWSSALTNGADSAKLRDIALTLSACPISVRLGSAELEPCVLGSVGFLHVSDSSALNAREADRSLWGLGALGRYRVPLTPLVGVEIEAGLSLPLVERRFVTDRPERIVAKTPWISPFIGLGAALAP